MIQLFPKLKKSLIIVEAGYAALMLVIYLITRNMPVGGAIFLTLMGMVVLFLIHNYFAQNMHKDLLNQLYVRLDVEGFLKEYEPMRKIKLLNPDDFRTVRMHLANAYCAVGRFQDALDVLKEIPLLGGMSEVAMVTRFAVYSNLCYTAEQLGDIELSQFYLNELRVTKQNVEMLQQHRARRRPLVYSIDMCEEYMKHLTGEGANIAVLKSLVRGSNQQLARLSASLWVARADIAQGDVRDAVYVLNQIAEIDKKLYPGLEARRLLATLPKLPPEQLQEKQSPSRHEADEKVTSKKKKKK